MEITPATRSHVPEIVEIWKEFMDFHKGVDPFFSRSENGHSNFEKFVESQIKSDDAQVLVALRGGRVVGYSISQISEYPPVFEHEKYGSICDLAVKANCRRKGIGELILSEILQWFESRNMERIELRVAAKNRIGYSFWKKHGFEEHMHVLYLNRPDRLKG